jgi:hypothetical protein
MYFIAFINYFLHVIMPFRVPDADTPFVLEFLIPCQSFE